MSFFKPEDFIYGFLETERCHAIAEIANAKLEKEGTVVYTEYRNEVVLNETKAWVTYKTTGGTHKALLINIEPMSKCEHPKEKVKVIKEGYVYADDTNFQCECGAVVRPSVFEEVK